ncbi:MAG: hypothetical protein RIR47_1299, partial [Bacteroidota bacterium]
KKSPRGNEGTINDCLLWQNQTRTITPQNYDRIFLFQKNRMNQLLNLMNGVLN